MTIFTYLNSILYSKKHIDINCEDEKQFNMYMVNRWTSMYSPELTNYVNNTTNYYWSLYDNKFNQYEYCYHVLPKLKFKKISYIKKPKVDKQKEKEEKLRVPDFISQTQYKYNVELLKQLDK